MMDNPTSDMELLPFDLILSFGSSSNEMFSQSATFPGTDQSNCDFIASSINFESNNSPSSHMSALPSHFPFHPMSMDADWPAILPTPPRSPDSSQVCDAIDDVDMALKDPVLDELIADADTLGILEGMELEFGTFVDDIINNSNWNPVCDPDAGDLAGGASEQLRHDCMWSGKCDSSCKQRTRCMSENSDICNLLTPAQSPLRNCCVSNDESKVNQSVNEFVDPSAVMSYTPHADHSYFSMDAEKIDDQVTTVSTPMPSATRKSRNDIRKVISDSDEDSSEDSYSNNEDDDDDDDDEDDEDDEEFIDVVSVHSMAPMAGNGQIRAHQRSLQSHATSSQRSLLKSKNSMKTAAHKQRKQRSSTSAPATPYLLSAPSPVPSSPAGPIEYPMPKVTSSGRVVQPTNRSASFLEAQPQVSSRGDHHRRRKRTEHSSSSSRHSKHVRSHGVSSRIPDSDDPEKRKEHNSMERKRRDDLRSNFQKLRELVPTVATNPKAAKVVILNQAASYANELTEQLEKRERILEKEKSRSEQLLKKLRALQRNSSSRSSGSSKLSSISAHAAVSV